MSYIQNKCTFYYKIFLRYCSLYVTSRCRIYLQQKQHFNLNTVRLFLFMWVFTLYLIESCFKFLTTSRSAEVPNLSVFVLF